MVSLLKTFLILLPPNILTVPSKRSVKNPLYPKMKLLAFHFSGKASETQTFKVIFQMLSQIRGEQPPKVDTNQFSCDGLFMPVQGTRNQFSCDGLFMPASSRPVQQLYSSCKCSVVIHAWYVRKWLFI